MNKVFGLVAGLYILFLVSANAQVVYFEDFEDDADNNLAAGTAVGGTWTTTYAGGGDSWHQQENQAFVGDVFLAENIQSEGIWQTNPVTISTSYVSLEIEASTAFTEAGDYCRAYYRINGGTEILFFDKATNFFELDVTGQTAIVPIAPGATIEILVYIFNDANNDYFVIDNVTIAEIRTLYSRTNTNWNAAGTWSSVAPGGVSCGCTPDDFTRQVIEGNTVFFTASANTTDLEIHAGGELDWNGNFDLNVIKQGTITVDAGGVVDRDGFADAQIDYDEAYPFSIVNNGTFTIGDIDVNASTTLIISGSTAISVAGDILIGGDAQITNNLVATFSVGGVLNFETGADADLVNNGVMTAASVFFDTDNSGVTNNGTLTLSGNISANGNGDDGNLITNNAGATLAFVNLDGNAAGATGDGGDLSIVNSGLINQSGTFLDIPNNTNGANDINNNNGATWTYAGTGHDTNLRLFTNGVNTFDYNGAGNQGVITPVAGSSYHHLTLSNNNQKTLAAAVTVNGDLSIANTAIFSANNLDITLLGNWTNSSTNADPFAEGTALVTFSGTAAQTITNTGDTQGTDFNNVRFFNTFGTPPQITIAGSIRVRNTLTMTQGIVDMGSNTFTHGLNAASPGTLVHGGTSASGFMYNGTLTRFFNTGTIANGSVVGLFPLGQTTTDFRPFSISCPTTGITTGGSFAVSVGSSTTTTDVSIADASAPATTITRQYQGAWTITNTGVVGGTYNLVAGGTGFGTIAALAHLRLHKVASAIGTHVVATGSTADPRLQRQTLTLAQLTTTGGAAWYVGSSDNVNSPLPIVLTYFKATPEGDLVKTEWETAQEIDNDFFTVQKTTDLETFYDVDKIPGQGNSREPHVYSLSDNSPFTGRSYYRLKQTDFDGKFSYSDLVTVDYDGPSSAMLLAYPNPSSGNKLMIELKGLQQSQSVPVHIYNQQGIKIYDVMLTEQGPGVIQHEVTFDQPLPHGLYIIKAGKTLQLTRKIVVN